MSFVVEDGTGVPNANAYIDVDFLAAYFADRGVVFTEDETVQQTWIVQATDYIGIVFGWRLIGAKKTDEQGLHFPATYAVTRQGVLLADDIVPEDLKKACAQYARRAKSGQIGRAHV